MSYQEHVFPRWGPRRGLGRGRREQAAAVTVGVARAAHRASRSLGRAAALVGARNVVDEVASVELCGAIKNVVALAAGFTDGLGMGSNTKAAIVRLGLKEMEAFIRHFYPATSSHVFSESCGVADLITTCFAGRNRKCAEASAAGPETIPNQGSRA